MRRHSLSLIPAVVVALALTTAGCGGGTETTDAPEPVATDAPEPVATDAPAPVATDAPEPVATDAPATGSIELTISAADNEGFSTSKLEAPAGVEITVTFDNKDIGSGEPHNWHLLDMPELVSTPLKMGPDKSSVTFTVDAPGEYQFLCDTHLTAMSGTFVVS